MSHDTFGFAELPVEWFDAPAADDPDFDVPWEPPQAADPFHDDLPSSPRKMPNPWEAWEGMIRCGTCHPEYLTGEQKT